MSGNLTLYVFAQNVKNPFPSNMRIISPWLSSGLTGVQTLFVVLPLRMVPIHGVDLTKREGIKKDDVTFCYTIPLLLND